MWLRESVQCLHASLQSRGSGLVLRGGPAGAAHELLAVAKETGAAAVFFNRRYEPAVCARVPCAASPPPLP